MVRTRASFSCSIPGTHKGCPAQLGGLICAEGLCEEWGSGCQACSSPLRKVLAQGTHSAWNEGHRAGHHPLSRCQTEGRIDTPRPWPALSRNGGWGPEGRGDSLFPPGTKRPHDLGRQQKSHRAGHLGFPGGPRRKQADCDLAHLGCPLLTPKVSKCSPGPDKACCTSIPFHFLPKVH